MKRTLVLIISVFFLFSCSKEKAVKYQVNSNQICAVQYNDNGKLVLDTIAPGKWESTITTLKNRNLMIQAMCLAPKCRCEVRINQSGKDHEYEWLRHVGPGYVPVRLNADAQ